MQVILNNPYRIVGLPVGATAKEQERQVKRLKQFIEADQDSKDDFCFPALGNIHRTIESVTDASTKLHLDNDKINAALFWFYKGNLITDEPAFDALKQGNIKGAVSIWAQLTNDKEVEKRNASAFHNLSNLLLNSSIINGELKEVLFEKGLRLKLRFLESDFINDFKELATDKTFKITKKELQLMFLNQLQSEIEKWGGSSSNKLLNILTNYEFSAKEDFLKGFVLKSIELIEQEIEKSKSKRKNNKANSIKIANSLLANIKDSIKLLKSIHGASSIKYTSISDKLALELFACGRDYFMHFKETETDPSDYSMKLFKKAKNFALGNITKNKIQDNIDELQEWIEERPEREKQRLIKEDLEFITSKLERFQKRNESISNAKDLVDSCKPKLFKIRISLGVTDDFYLKISGAVVNNVQAMLVNIVNDEQDLFQFSLNPASITIEKITEIAIKKSNGDKEKATSLLQSLIIEKYIAKENLKTTIRGAVSVSSTLGELDMDSQLKTRYNKNNATLLSLASKLDITLETSETTKPIVKPIVKPTPQTPDSGKEVSVSKTKEDHSTWIFLGVLALIAIVEYAIFGTFWIIGVVIFLYIIGSAS